MSAESDGHDSRPLRVTFIFEYGPAEDWMLASLIEGLQARLPGLKPACIHGLFGIYRPGGLQWRRLANLAWVFLRTALHLVLHRPDAVLVRTAPPGVQVWTVWWASLRGVPVFCWLMDYHPEMEARLLEKRGFGRVARLLRGIDANAMRRFAAVIALDRAMARLARERSGGVEVLEHPTWGAGSATLPRPVSYRPGGGGGPLRLAYSGNLGAAHDLTLFSTLLEKLTRHHDVELFVIGSPPQGVERFRRLCARFGLPLKTHGRVPFAQLQGLYEEWRIDAGIVLLAGESAGLVSPSKFSGYINFGLPLIYIGPPETNTADVCTRFGGGFWLSDRADREQISAVANALLDGEQMAKAVEGARAAAEHFIRLNHESLAAALAPRLVRCASA
jgi:hypothetical protein